MCSLLPRYLGLKHFAWMLRLSTLYLTEFVWVSWETTLSEHASVRWLYGWRLVVVLGG